MAVVNLKSSPITNRDATPPVLNNEILEKGILKSAIGKITANADDSIASIYRILRIPTNARLSNLLLTCGAITSAAGDIGLYRETARNGDAGAAVDVDFFASAQSLATAVAKTSVLNESTTNTIAKQNQPLWQAVGESSDPGGYYDVCVTLTAASTAGADLQLEAIYCE